MTLQKTLRIVTLYNFQSNLSKKAVQLYEKQFKIALESIVQTINYMKFDIKYKKFQDILIQGTFFIIIIYPKMTTS